MQVSRGSNAREGVMLCAGNGRRAQMAAVQDSNNRAIPEHVPRELVHSIGLTEGPEFLAAPHRFMAALHDTHPPIFYNISEHAGNAWLLTKYDDVCYVLTHPKIFGTQGATPFPRDPN